MKKDSDIQDECSISKNQEFLDLIDQKNVEIASLHDKLLRSLADFDNFKKRIKRESDIDIHCAIRNLLESFLPIGDNLDRALNIASANSDDQIIKGLDMIRQSFHFALEKHGVTTVQSVGCSFDPNFHEAIHQIESTEFGPGIIVTEYERGYIRDGKLLRPARVIVTKGNV